MNAAVAQHVQETFFRKTWKRKRFFAGDIDVFRSIGGGPHTDLIDQYTECVGADKGCSGVEQSMLVQTGQRGISLLVGYLESFPCKEPQLRKQGLHFLYLRPDDLGFVLSIFPGSDVRFPLLAIATIKPMNIIFGAILIPMLRNGSRGTAEYGCPRLGVPID